MHPVNGRLTWDVMWVNHNGPTGRSMRVDSGQFDLSLETADSMTWVEVVEMVLKSYALGREAPAPPLGDMGEQLSLNLYLRP